MRHRTNEFEIRWFRENTTGAVEDLGLGEPNGSLESMHWFSRYHNSDFINQQYNPSYLGKYWCQVINTTADPDQPLMRSNVFTLLAPENYTQPTCVSQNTTTQTMENITCADLPVHSEQTTLPAPRSEMQSTILYAATATGVVLLIIIIISLLLIVILLVQRRRRRRKEYVMNECNSK